MRFKASLILGLTWSRPGELASMDAPGRGDGKLEPSISRWFGCSDSKRTFPTAKALKCELRIGPVRLTSSRPWRSFSAEFRETARSGLGAIVRVENSAGIQACANEVAEYAVPLHSRMNPPARSNGDSVRGGKAASASGRSIRSIIVHRSHGRSSCGPTARYAAPGGQGGGCEGGLWRVTSICGQLIFNKSNGLDYGRKGQGAARR